MSLKIGIHLGSSATNTTATVTRRKWFRIVTENYHCFKSDAIMGGQWINTDTNLRPSNELESALNAAAYAALCDYRSKQK